MAKGGDYERELSEKFSLWWSGGKSDDLFWRSAGSGGRATVRTKKFKAVIAGAGDIIPTAAESMPFNKVFCIEAKRGYHDVNAMAILDALPPPPYKPRPPKPPKPGQKPKKKKPYKPPPSLANWLAQADAAAASQKIPFFLLVHRRDKKKAVVYYPPLPFLKENEIEGPTMRIVSDRVLFVAELDAFLAALPPDRVRKYAESLKE